MNPQYFKGDAQELKFDAAFEPTLTESAHQRDLFLEGAYETAPLGELLFDNSRAPLANAIPRDVYRAAFKEIFDAFVACGTFEAYLTVFRKIFGEDADIEFTIPAAGKLNIDIEASSIVLTNFVSRYISSGAYVYDNMQTIAGEDLVFQSIAGLQSQYEVELMLHEMIPGGIFSAITLTFI